MSISEISGSLSYQPLTLNASSLAGSSQETGSSFADLDVDGDGGVSLDESGFSEDDFAVMDTDGDGLLTSLDMEAQIIEMMAQKEELQAKDASALMEEMDTDGDGYVTETELENHRDQLAAEGMEPPMTAAELMEEADSDGDGMISESELESHFAKTEQTAQGAPPPPPPEEEDDEDETVSATDLLSALDSDEDGSLSVEETGLSSESFDVLDTNEDGVVSQEELEATYAYATDSESAEEESTSISATALSVYLAMSAAYLSTDSYQSLSLTA